MVSRAALLYIALVVGAAIGILMRARMVGAPFDVSFWIQLNVLRALFLICDALPAPLASGQSAWSPSSAATLAAVVLLGPRGGALVGAVALLTPRRHLRLVQRLFNAAMYTVAGYAAGEAYVALHGPVGSPTSANFAEVIGPFAAAAVVHVLVNHGLIWAVLRLDRGGRLGTRQARAESRSLVLLVSDVGYAAFGLVIAVLWMVMGAFSVALALVPLFVARWAIAQFGAQRKAYEATMRALAQAVETKDFYTRGHGDRVSKGVGMIADKIGMRGDRAEALRFAGMLHDVGKLGVPIQVLQKEGPLTEEEFAAIQLHPMRGLEIVREIGFLNEALNGITHHHERIDGRGYPMGLADDEIPEFARIIGVADAFDSMTSTRSYRSARTVEGAVAELRKGAGTQFDPVIVEAFIAALDEEPWAPPKAERAPVDVERIIVQDHDDPTAPLRVVGGT